jgi:hypothetical protein
VSSVGPAAVRPALSRDSWASSPERNHPPVAVVPKPHDTLRRASVADPAKPVSSSSSGGRVGGSAGEAIYGKARRATNGQCAARRRPGLKLSASSVENRFMRQCPTCLRVYPRALGRGAYCSVDCELSRLRRIRSAVRLRRLARIVKAA